MRLIFRLLSTLVLLSQLAYSCDDHFQKRLYPSLSMKHYYQPYYYPHQLIGRRIFGRHFNSYPINVNRPYRPATVSLQRQRKPTISRPRRWSYHRTTYPSLPTAVASTTSSLITAAPTFPPPLPPRPRPPPPPPPPPPTTTTARTTTSTTSTTTTTTTTHEAIIPDNLKPPQNHSQQQQQRDHFIETLVFADSSVRDRFENFKLARDFVLSIIGLANELFALPSLKTKMRIVVLDVIWIPERESQDFFRKNSLERSVHSFCQWALKKHYPAYNYDHALLLSRRVKDAAGISTIGHMCSMELSCTLVEEYGFFSAYPLAHELLHNLGVEHDGQDNSCDESGHSGNIMAPMIHATSLNHHWSDCTKLLLHKNLRLDRYACIRDFPYLRPDFELPGSVGSHWSIDQQCQIHTGHNASRSCHPPNDSQVCDRLWCSISQSTSECQLLDFAALDGTHCAEGKECRAGRCLESQPSVVSFSGWGDYSSWSPCSVPCGTGTSFRQRICLDQRRGCPGQAKEYRTCNQKPCPTLEDARGSQCKRFNAFKLRGKFHQWHPYILEDDKCRLSCYAHGGSERVNALSYVRDSTLCDYEAEDSRCIQGRCVNFDCLGVVNGTATRDRCGVCGGRGTTCISVYHQFRKQISRSDKYVMLYVIPKLSRDIRITKHSIGHIIGLMDIKNLRYIIKGDELADGQNSTLVYLGAKFSISRASGTDIIYVKGPILGDIVIEVSVISSKHRLSKSGGCHKSFKMHSLRLLCKVFPYRPNHPYTTNIIISLEHSPLRNEHNN